MQEREIIKYLNGTSSKTEQKRVEDWIIASQENRKKFNELKGLYVAATFEETDQETDIEKGYTKFASATKSKSKYYKLRPYYKYVAAASVLLVVALTIFLNRGDRTPQFIEPIIVNTQIEPGTDKAILTLEDGSVVALEKGKAFQTKNANSNGEEIIYEVAKRNTKEVAYNYLTIPRGGQFYIKLSDGTQVWLNSESQLKYPVAFIEGETRQVELVYGEAYFDVSPSSAHHETKFKVNNAAQEVEVLGTEFNIKAYKDESNVYTTLVEGKVAVNALNKIKILKPNEQLNLNLSNSIMESTPVDVYRIISWKEGVFSFKNRQLKDIMKVLSRWYDVKVVFNNETLETITFNGSLDKKLSIEEILAIIIGSTNNISYEINSKTILLK